MPSALPPLPNSILSDFRTSSLQSNSALLSSVFATYNLTPLYSFFIQNNPSNTIPYHNHYHARCIGLNSLEGYAHTTPQPQSSEIRILLAAALFHDYNHSGGQFPDSVNIHQAVAGLNEANQATSALSTQEFNEAAACIQSTQYPHIYKPQSFLQAILCDADYMQPFEEDLESLRHQFLGLKQELDYSKLLYSPESPVLSIEEFVAKLCEFYRSHSWHTEWAQLKAHTLNWPQRINRLAQVLTHQP